MAAAAGAAGGAEGDGFDYQIKLLLIGDTGVGKTCLLLRYVDDRFSSTFITTIGIDFKFKNLMVEGKRVKLQLWDTAGQERFRTITTSYFRGARAVALVYDVTNRESFNNISNWAAQIREHAGDITRVLIANKADLSSKAKVTTAEGQALAAEGKMLFFECSAKSNLNVDEAFQAVATQAVKDIQSGRLAKRKPSGVDVRGGGGGGGCSC